MIGEVINLKIKEQVNIILNKKEVNGERDKPKTLSDFINALIIVHIKYWQFEDSIEEINNFSTIGRLKQETNSLFKVERPELIKLIDGTIMKLLRGDDIPKAQRCFLVSFVSNHINDMKLSGKIDLLYSDTLSELIDKIIIMQIRRWHIKNSLLGSQSDNALLKLKNLDEDKIPMLIKCLDKLLLLVATKKVDFTPVNVKFYNGVNR